MKNLLYKLSTLWILYTMLYIKPVQIQAKSNSQNAPIIGGSRAALGQFPWHVLLRRDAQDQCLCGGSIISNKWVLTAAHCIYNRTFVHLEFGTINLYFDGVVMNSTKLFIYPEYDDEELYDDIGLIELPEPLEFTDNIKAIDIVSYAHASDIFVDCICTVTGFGWTSDHANIYSEWLLWATVQVITNEECARKLNEESIEDSEMCAVGYSGSNMSPCRGDSGGALIWKNEENKEVQIGVVSSSKENHCSEYPTSYMRVTSFLDYIHNITGLENQ